MSQVSCRSCGHDNPEDANFCAECGAALVPTEDQPTMSFDVTVTGEHPVTDLEASPEAGLDTLVVARGPKAGSRYALDSEVVTAGRHPDSDIFLDDITVSRRHAEIVRTDRGWEVRDRGSLNGTYVNRERIESAVLAEGDEVQVGKFKLRFVTGRGG